MPAIITSSAGPLCVSHSETWRSRAKNTPEETYIRLCPPTTEPNANAVTVLVSLVKSSGEIEGHLRDVLRELELEHGISDLKTHFKRREETASVTFRLAPPEGGEPEPGDLRGLAVIRRYRDAFTRFDFVAPEEFYNAHYKEAWIMSASVDFVE